MKLPAITSAEKLIDLVEEIGFLPFFRCPVKGFSLEECTPSGYWFVDGVDGPWEWKGEAAESKKIAYGKLFSKKAGYVSMEWYPTLANYRRSGYDFDARYDDGLANRNCKRLMDTLESGGAMLSKDIKQQAEFSRKGEFDSAVTQLQMQTYITVKSFEYQRDRFGAQYGWGVARYELSERLFGGELVRSRYEENPDKSFERMAIHIASLFSNASEKEILKLLK